MKYDDDYLVFNDGTRCYANNGVIGISPELWITQGFDGEFWMQGILTPEQIKELAEYMIAQWQRVADGEGPPR